MKSSFLSRRTALKGLGATLALPWLEAMGPMTGWAAGSTPTSKAAPNRMALLYVPNGKNMVDWTPKTEGDLPAELPAILQPLAEHRRDFSILTGLTADKARSHGDGGGDHALSAVRPVRREKSRRCSASGWRMAGSSAGKSPSSFGVQSTMFLPLGT